MMKTLAPELSTMSGSLPEGFDLSLLEPEVDPATGIDLSLIDLNLQMTAWERIVANNDLLNFSESLRAGMEQLHAPSGQAD